MDKDLKEMIEYPERGILSKIIFKNENSEATLFCMASGTKISEHTSVKKGVIYVLEGKGTFKLEGKKIIMKEGVFIHMKENSVHSLNAEKNMSFLLFLY